MGVLSLFMVGQPKLYRRLTRGYCVLYACYFSKDAILGVEHGSSIQDLGLQMLVIKTVVVNPQIVPDGISYCIFTHFPEVLNE
jgi:hypothetical protein